MRTNPEATTSLRSPYRHRPSHIKTSRQQAFRQRLCEICLNIDLKLDSVSAHLEQAIGGHDVLSEMSVCSPPTSSCLNRNCDHCGVENAEKHIKQNLTCASTSVKWQSWDLVRKENGQRKEKVEHEGTITDLVKILMKDLTTYSKHVFVYRWQFQQYKALLAKLPSLQQIAVMVCDFAENYLCRYQNEVHSAHWGYNQVTVHPCVLFYPCLACRSLVTDYLVFLSDDLTHGAHMVETILANTKGYLRKEAGIEKSKLPFFYMSSFTDVEWAYFGSRHGKSPCDSCGGAVKTAVDEDVVGEGITIQDAETMYQHLMLHHSLPDPDSAPTNCVHTMRSYWVIRKEDINRPLPSSALKTIKGTRQVHSLRGLGDKKISTRNLSCFCDCCMGDVASVCTSKGYAEDWQQKEINFAKSWSTPSALSHGTPPTASESHAQPASPPLSLPDQ